MQIFTKDYWKEVFSPELIIKTTFQTIIGTVMVGMFFMFFSDYVFKPVDLNGRWSITLHPESALSHKIKCVDIEYTVLIVQNGLEITAGGEKTRDKKSTKPECKDANIYERDIDPGAGERIDISGFINKQYLSNDVLTLSYSEGNQQRFTMGVLKINKKDNLSGWYESNISQTRGTITLEKAP